MPDVQTNDTQSTRPSLLFKYVNIAGLRRILSGSIRFTQPSAFNDPFELLPEIVTPLDAQERQLRVSFDIGGRRTDVPNAIVDKIPSRATSLTDDIPTPLWKSRSTTY